MPGVFGSITGGLGVCDALCGPAVRRNMKRLKRTFFRFILQLQVQFSKLTSKLTMFRPMVCVIFCSSDQYKLSPNGESFGWSLL